MGKLNEQSAEFIEFMLRHAETLEFAAAEYGDNGKVGGVRNARLRVQSMEDWSKLEPWLRAQNTRNPANIWVRPAVPDHAIVMLDDLPAARALAVVKKYRGAAVETSPGNCQAVIVLAQPLGREARQDVARSLCRLIGSDPGSISEPRWFRMPGFRGRKPGKECWTNLLAINADGVCLDPGPHLAPCSDNDSPAAAPYSDNGGPIVSRPRRGAAAVALPVAAGQINPGDQHLREFAFACHSLRHGVPPDAVVASIAARALERGKRRNPARAEEYARHTVRAALARLQR
jgi:hypothetical protein